MSEFDLYSFYKKINNDGIIFCYCGPISHSTIEGIGQTLRLDLEIVDAGFNTSQSIFSIFIEQMQNILNYSADKIAKDTLFDKELRAGVLVIGRVDDGFYIYCGNKMLNEDVPKLQGKIEQIVSMDKEQLKSLYKERRKQSPEEGSKGAGLGLIEMARKAGKPIDYTFTPIDNEFSFFSIKVIVERR
jgi:hypothetical protein